ncbi:MAG: zinc ribbon domain-containing protein [Fusobacteriaceae bacterium]|jgi:predicted amidophosphoribosyltransferase|nr:zinc ribbon domain-containing protein [Fusobacteriaceae bacterium]
MSIKIKELGRGLGEKITDIIEINKLTIKISGKKSEISKLKTKLGEVVYDKFKEGNNFDEESNEILNTIKSAEEEITELQNRIAALKTDLKTTHINKKCPICGIENINEAKFCKECGAKLEKMEESTIEKETTVCAQCGMVNNTDAKFCQGCGENLEKNKTQETKAENVKVREEKAEENKETENKVEEVKIEETTSEEVKPKEESTN